LRELQQLFDTHTLFAMPAFYEPWGLVYLEAMACKMPIMGLNRNSLPELSRHGEYGFCIDDDNPNAIAAILVDCCANPDRLKKMGEEAQSYCLAKFSWERTVAQIMQVIEENYNHF
jgi:glycosyltransferase involved in cell wall biosynthesis